MTVHWLRIGQGLGFVDDDDDDDDDTDGEYDHERVLRLVESLTMLMLMVR